MLCTGWIDAYGPTLNFDGKSVELAIAPGMIGLSVSDISKLSGKTRVFT